MPTVFSRTPQGENLKNETNRKIRELMMGVAGQPLTLYQVVAGGPVFFRQNFLHAFRGLAVDDHIANMVFMFFCEQVVKRHPAAGETAKQIATTVLDAAEVPSPPTQAEIDHAWVHEVASA